MREPCSLIKPGLTWFRAARQWTIQMAVRRAGCPCASLWSPCSPWVGESSWFHVAKAAKKVTARPRTSSSAVGASRSVLTPTQWPPARSVSVSSALSSEREREKKKSQAHFKGQSENSIVSPCHSRRAVAAFDKFLFRSYLITSGLHPGTFMPLPVFEPTIWYDAIYRGTCHMHCYVRGRLGGVGDTLDIYGLWGQGCRGC